MRLQPTMHARCCCYNAIATITISSLSLTNHHHMPPPHALYDTDVHCVGLPLKAITSRQYCSSTDPRHASSRPSLQAPIMIGFTVQHAVYCVHCTELERYRWHGVTADAQQLRTKRQYRNGKTAKRQNGKTAKPQNDKTAKRQNGKTAKRQNGKMAKPQNGKMAKWQNGKTAKWQNGKMAK